MLDEPLLRAEVQKRIREADQNLPTDEWKTTTGALAAHWNDSRKKRDLSISRELLAEVQPKLKLMPVPQLLHSIKAERDDLLTKIDGVTYFLYVEGNEEILKELKQRPAHELEYLKKYRGDLTFIFGCPQGPNATLGQLCGEVLYERGMGR